MKAKNLVLITFILTICFGNIQAESLVTSSTSISELVPGPGDKEKKKKKKDDEDGVKMKKIKYKPSKHAKQSAKGARRAMKAKDKQVMGRAKVRMFFHNMFNRKYGKTVNFRSKRQRNRWKRGR